MKNHYTRNSTTRQSITLLRHNFLKLVFAFAVIAMFAGCVEDKVEQQGFLSAYQAKLVDSGPQTRASDKGLDILKPLSEPNMPQLAVIKDDSTGISKIELTLDEALVRALSNSPEITVISFDPSIARQDVTAAVSEFDVTAFGQFNYETTDVPVNSAFSPGQSNTRLFESGLKQKGTTGAEWSVMYAITRGWDDLEFRPLSTRYEPMLMFQIKQPLLRDAWEEINLSGVNLSKLNYRIALAGFRQKAEEISTQIIFVYWTLLQSRRDHEIQTDLLAKTLETFEKVKNRQNIDATTVQIKQAESSVKTRQGELYEVKKRLSDVQDELARLLSDHQINVLSDYEIIPTTEPKVLYNELDPYQLLNVAIANNAIIEQANIGVEVANINVAIATRQLMPRLDLIASARTQSLGAYQGQAMDRFGDYNYVSYAAGIAFEYPLGNRQRKSEKRKRVLERSRALAATQNVSDQVATLVKERIRLIDTAYQKMQIQKEAVDAAAIHLQALEDTELIREKLTPEFLLVKLQAQESLAMAQKTEIKAIVDYNTSLTRLAQATGTVLELRYVRKSLPIAFTAGSATDSEQASSPQPKGTLQSN